MKSCPECYSEYEDGLERCPADSSLLKSGDRDPLVGTRLGDRYEIVSVIGRGGMGVVYKARQEQMDKLMAIKMLHSHMVSDSEAVKRFYREAKTVSQVKHHHIVTLYDFGMSSQGQPFLVMDYLQGVSLKDELKHNGPLSFERADRIFGQIVDGLAAAHSLDVVHRDLKPENIVLSSNAPTGDWVTLVDFGLSKLKEPKTQDAYTITKTGDVCGSPPYMSPEQCLAASAVDPRSDVYSLGIVAYESLSGFLPYKAKSAIEMMDCHLYGTPTPFSQASTDFKVCTEVTNVLNKALAKEPEQRQQDILEFGKELHEALARDGMKLKSYKHRMEIADFKDMESEAEALMTGSYPTLGLAAEGHLNAINNQTALEIATNTQVDSNYTKGNLQTGAHEVVDFSNNNNNHSNSDEQETNAQRNWISRVMSAVFGPRPPSPVEHEEEEELESNLPYANCPYCQAPVRSMIRFCISCQRQLPSAAEYARMRVSAGSKLVPAKSQFNTGRHAKPGFSNRAKESMNRQAYPGITKFLMIGLVGACIYAGSVALKNPEFVKTMKRTVAAFQK
ncbi:serine/threonine protein kinase [bacterium]|nr:serine/threonine protein kinase [bacterium]MBP9808714.1 serine/threonine protein kinase [bacterium]